MPRIPDELLEEYIKAQHAAEKDMRKNPSFPQTPQDLDPQKLLKRHREKGLPNKHKWINPLSMPKKKMPFIAHHYYLPVKGTHVYKVSYETFGKECHFEVSSFMEFSSGKTAVFKVGSICKGRPITYENSTIHELSAFF